MKKILAILGTLSLAVSTSSTVIACYDNTASETQPEKKLSLSQVIEKTELGHFDYRPTGQQILAKLSDLNPQLDIEEIQVVEIDDKLEQAKISVNPQSEIYEISTLFLTFKVKKWIKIDEVISELNLGHFDYRPTGQQILAKLKDLHPELDIKEIQVVEINDEVGHAKVRAISNSKKYESNTTLTLSFTVTKWTEIKAIIKEVDLGDFKKIPTEKELMDRLIKRNPKLDRNQIELLKLDGSNEQIYKAIVIVKDNATSYLPGTIVISYRLLLVHLDEVIQNREIGIFNPNASDAELLEKVGTLNSELDLNEVYLTRDLNNRNVATVKVKSESLSYFQKELKINFWTDHTKGINQIVEARTKALILSDQFGISQRLAYKQIVENDQTIPNEVNDYFHKNPLEGVDVGSNINLKGYVGEYGGLFGLLGLNSETTLPEGLELGSILEGIKDLPGGYKEADSSLIFSNISQILNIGLEFLSALEIVFVFEIIPIIGGWISDFAPIGTFTKIKDQFNELVENNLSKEMVGSFLDAFKNGTDLTPLAAAENLTLLNFQAAMVFGLFNTLGYAVDPAYEEFDVVKEVSKKEVSYDKLAKVFAKWLDKKIFDKLDFNLNPTKIIENLLLTINILNHLLTEYKTPEIDFYNAPANKKRSDHIFSDTVINNEYMRDKSKQLVKGIKTNWNGFNIGELLSNIKYYLGADKAILKYRLQQLSYLLLSSGDDYAPIPRLLETFVLDQVYAQVPSWILWSVKTAIKNAVKAVMYEYFIHQLVNNWKVKIQSIKGFVWNNAKRYSFVINKF